MQILKIILVLFLVGCSGTPPLHQSNKDPTFTQKIDNLLIITYMEEYENRYNRKITSYFEKRLSEKLSEVGVRNVIVKPPSILNLQPQTEIEKITDKNFEFILALSPYNFLGDGRANIQASLWRREEKNYIWKGFYRFSGGWGTESAGNELGERIFLGLQYDGLINGAETRQQTDLISNKSGSSAPKVSPIGDEKIDSIEKRLADLKKLFDKGLINKTEYDAKKQAILNSL